MVTRKLDANVEITLSDELQIISSERTIKRRSGVRPTSGAIPMPTSSGQTSDDDLILASLEKSGMEVITELEIEPTPQTGTQRRSSAPNGGTAEFKVDLQENEEAVMLLEQDGMYVWKYATETKMEAASVRRRGTDGKAAQKRLIFTVEIADSTEKSTNEQHRGVFEKIKEFAWGKLKAYVLKFAAAATVELARKHLERNVSHGIVHIKSANPETWQLVNGLKDVPLPQDMAPKIFLFVHGTFSSTVGGYGALGTTPWGKSFLESVLNTYDAVIGFNHATLSEDPLQNAQQLLDIFQSIHWPIPPKIDVVAHSRGGLVIRSLIEKLLPQQNWKPTFGKVIFVASTNGGTLLAEPQNWESLVTLYTNLAAGACRVMGLISPQSKVISLVLGDIIQSIGSFIKYCADSAITDRLIPGLSAMEPDGAFIKDINLMQKGQPALDETYYCVITSEFSPRLTGTHEPKELPKRFLSLLGGKFIERLMKEANDLVVNTKSMGAVDLESGNFIKERYEFGVNPQVYHTNYFTRPEVANALTRWLSLAPLSQDQRVGENAMPKRRTRSLGGGSPVVKPVSSPLQPLPSAVPLDIILPPQVDTDIITINAAAPIESLRSEIAKKAPSYIVIRRPYQGSVLNYAVEAEEALRIINTQNDTSVIDAFNLHETDASGTRQVGENIESKELTGGNIMASRDVIEINNMPVGVVPEKKDLPDAEELARRAQMVFQPKTEEERIMVRRSMPTFTAAKGGPTTRGIRKPELKVTCYFRAEMDAEVIVKRATTIMVTISRELLEQMAGAASASRTALVTTEKKILVRVVAKSGFIVIDENEGRADIDVPQLNQPQELSFDVRATEEGEGEIWILIKQEQAIVAKLILKPKIVKSRSLTSEKVTTEKVTADPKPLYKPLHQLDIEERKTEDGFIYRYRINSPGLQIKLQFDSKPIKGDREKYVADLYKRIEERWLSSGKDEENFAEELRAFGAELFDELIPEKLQKLLWQRRVDFDSIQVISSEPFIPWELLHLRDPDKRGMPEETIFLAQMGLIRWLDGAGENGWPPNTIKIRNGEVRYVIPKYPHPNYRLPEAEKEEDFLISLFAAKEATPESGEVRKIISKPAAFDLLHFACHGVAESNNISEASLLMQGREEGGSYIIDSLSATTAAKFSNLKSDDNEPMVVVNACQAGRAGYKLTGIGGFAHAFLMGGAGAFVGTLWSVGDSPARTFTETLYKTLNNGKNLSEATIEARKAAMEAGEATWLAYVVYGHPHLKIMR